MDIFLLSMAIFSLVFLSFKEKDMLRVDFSAISKFLAFMALVICARLGLNSFMLSVGAGPIVDEKILSKTEPWVFMLVWLEDLAFAAPIYLFKQYISKNKWFWIPIAIGFSLFFASQHVYLGYSWALVTILYPYLISCKYSLRFGFGTVMMCHVLYDFITYYTTVLSNYQVGK